MKQFTFLLLLIAFQLSAQAQPEIGVTLGPGTTWLLNNNASDQADNLNYSTSFGFQGGLHAGYFFTDNIGLAAELNLATVNQKYEGDFTSVHYEAGDHLTYISIPILFQLKTLGGFYFELGPQFNILSSAKGDLTLEDDPFSANYDGRDIETGFNKTVVGGTFGMGGRFDLAENMALTAGIRFFGGFGDATEEFTEEEFNALDGDEIGVTVFYAHTDQSGNFRYEKTMEITGSLMIGFVYVFVKK